MTDHNQLSNIRTFMLACDQQVRTVPTKPPFGASYKERLLRARLILEEALEQVNALGFVVCDEEQANRLYEADTRNETPREEFIHENHNHDEFPCVLIFRDTLIVNLSHILDGIVDQDYVSKGTLFTFGLQDLLEDAERLVHESNMSKFWTLTQLKDIDTDIQNHERSATLKPNGRYLVRSKEGKVIKPPTFKAPDLEGLVVRAIANSKLEDKQLKLPI